LDDTKKYHGKKPRYRSKKECTTGVAEGVFCPEAACFSAGETKGGIRGRGSFPFEEGFALPEHADVVAVASGNRFVRRDGIYRSPLSFREEYFYLQGIRIDPIGMADQTISCAGMDAYDVASIPVFASPGIPASRSETVSSGASRGCSLGHGDDACRGAVRESERFGGRFFSGRGGIDGHSLGCLEEYVLGRVALLGECGYFGGEAV
jgi:hypothetical protein